MIRTLACLGAIVSLCSAAVAADLPLRAGFDELAAPAPLFTWTGFYLGGHAGYGSSTNRFNGSIPELNAALPGAAALSVGNDADGYVAGGQLGYNVQFGQGGGVVLGVEADLAATGLGRTTAIPLPAGLGLAGSYRTALKELGTVRGRLGYGLGPVLVYGTGGFAFGNAARRGTLTAGGENIAALDIEDLDVGYAVGGGVEYAILTSSPLLGFPGAVTVRGEYLHYDLGQHGTPFDILGEKTVLKMHNEGDLGRFAVNYKF